MAPRNGEGPPKDVYRIVYEIPWSNTESGHRSGVNSLAIDGPQGILYSGGRDGRVCMWDTGLGSHAKSEEKLSTKIVTSIQSHTSWINDILLADNGNAIVSGSSDACVKIWRPHSAESKNLAHKIGQHGDFVKVLAMPSTNSDWVASGGLDRTVRVWDMDGKGEIVKFSNRGNDEGDDVNGNIYALHAKRDTIVAGSPNGIISAWDKRSGQLITKIAAHTDNVRAIIASEDGNLIMTGSTDQSIQVWSLSERRRLAKLRLHNDSVWSLYSESPDLSTFISTDRSGWVVKTDFSDAGSEGVSLALAQEHGGVHHVAVSSGYFWTATPSSSINRWKDVDMSAAVAAVKHRPSLFQTGISILQNGISGSSESTNTPTTNGTSSTKAEKEPSITIQNFLRPPVDHRSSLSRSIGLDGHARKGSEIVVAVNMDEREVKPVFSLPEETVEGHVGLIQSLVLNDRMRALTLDTAGEVLLWDLVRCVIIKAFGKRHLDEVYEEVNNKNGILIDSWCKLTVRTAQLSVILEENNFADCELYVDEMYTQDGITSSDPDHKINLGRWVLNNIFRNLVAEESKRDQAYRAHLVKNQSAPTPSRESAPLSLNTLLAARGGPAFWNHVPTPEPLASPSANTLTPATALMSPTTPHGTPGFLDFENSPTLRKINSRGSGDYFSNAPPPPRSVPGGPPAATNNQPRTPTTPGEPGEKSKGGFRARMAKVLGKEKEKVPEENQASSETTRSSQETSQDTVPKLVDSPLDSQFFGVIRRMKHEYEVLAAKPTTTTVDSAFSLVDDDDSPKIQLPPSMKLYLQVKKKDTKAFVDIYDSFVENSGTDIDTLETLAPRWLGELLLKNDYQIRDGAKIQFELTPFDSSVPVITKGLTAARMLRASKISDYALKQIRELDMDVPKAYLDPEARIELLYNGELVDGRETLVMIRSRRGGKEVPLVYRLAGHQGPQSSSRQAAASTS